LPVSYDSGVTYDFPPELVRLRQACDEADATWSQIAAGEVVIDQAGEPISLDQAYRRTQELVLALHRNEWLAAVEDGHAARQALREAARKATES
jgi:hypothetical protein